MLKAIIPVMNRSLACRLLKTIFSNTIRPDEVVIIDNSELKEPFPLPQCCESVRVLKMEKNIGVNAAWNLGVEETKACDFVSILNDDVLVGPSFFARNQAVFAQKSDCAVACPNTFHSEEDWSRCPDAPRQPMPVEMRKREGWAFTFKREVLNQIPSIPSDLRIFCGDDWYWYFTHRLGKKWYKEINNVIYHKVGASASKQEFRGLLKTEKRLFTEILAKIERK